MVFNLLNRLKEFPELKIFALSLNNGILADKLSREDIDITIISEQQNSFLSILLKAAAIFKNQRIDIIHSHRYKENLIALLLKKRLKAKTLITTLHGLVEKSEHDRKPSILNRAKIFLNDYILKKFFTTVSVSDEIHQFLTQQKNYDTKKVKVIHNGIEPPFSINRNPKQNVFHIGIVGRFVPVKNYDLFLEIAAFLKKAGNDLRFSILGEGPLKEYLVQKRDDFGLTDCITFLEPVSDPFPFYSSLDLYINTSHHEGIPLTILEAMSCGVPVIAPRVGGIPEIIGHYEDGFLVDNYEPEVFADTCLMLLNNTDLRINIGRKARQKIKSSFSAEHMAASYRLLYGSRLL